MSDYVKDSLAYSRDNFIRFLVEGKREFTTEECEVRKERLGLSWLKPPFVVVNIAPEYGGIKYAEKDQVLWEYEQYVHSYLTKRALHVYCQTNSRNNVMVLLSLATDVKRNLDEIFIELHDKLVKKFDMDVFIGIGSVAEHFQKIYVSAQDALDMLGYKYQYADRGVINIQNLVQFQCNISGGNGIEFDRVIGCFQDGNLGKMEQRMNELVEFVRHRPNVSRTSIRRTLVELTVHILHVASNANADVDVVLEGVDPYRWIMQQNHTEVITEWIMKISSKLLLLMHEHKETEEKSAILQAKKFIDENLSRSELGLMRVSEEIGLSSTYFSELFKKEVGMGLNAYIVQCRISRAQQLLRTTELQSAEIARQLGFSTPGYFGQVFKKIVGMTPNDYRRKTYGSY